MQQGLQQGLQRGLLSGIEVALDIRFGRKGLDLLPEICKIEDLDVLRAIHQGVKTVSTLEELRSIYQR
ncbi:MAG: hypothetical protein GXP41_09330 [Chloroflexi bacterium]|nr:hypothetical protein [Chloroflexota bacterium]